MTTGEIRILATGGTIAGRSGPAGSQSYAAGQIGISQLLAEAGATHVAQSVQAREIAAIGSQDIGWREWCALREAIVEACADPAVGGIVVTHGTDTAEETAFLLDLTLPAGKPVVLAGAMRPADALGSDGMRNLANALRTVCDPAAGHRGVLLVMGDKVFAARDARKATTQGMDAFRGFPRGPIAAVSPTSVEWFAPPARAGMEARFGWPDALPRVEILHVYAGMDRSPVDCVVADGAKGIVIAGLGQGNAPRGVLEALGEAATQGILVVRASRTDEGLVDRNVEVDDDGFGFVASRALNPAKARILLQLLLANGQADPALCQAAFDY